MRIVVTGGGGTLGRALAPVLSARGHKPVLVDIEDVPLPFESVRCDIRDAAAVRQAFSGADVVVHAAAIHGIHLRDHSPQEFFDLNLRGTFNMWEACVAGGVRAVVFSSTMGVYGETGRPVTDDSVVALTEDLPLRPADVYGFTKLAGEQMCQYYGRQSGIPSVALRFGMFVPEPFIRYGIRLLYGGVDTDDVVAAVIRAVDVLIGGTIEFEAVNVHSRVPFTEQDGPGLRTDPLAVLETHYPGSAELLRGHGITRLEPIQSFYPVTRLEEVLGVQPSCNFDQWLEDLIRRPNERADNDPPWP